MDFLTRVSALAYLGPAFLFTTRDLADDLWNQHYNYGLYAQDYRPKPVVEALRRLTTN